MKKKSIKHSVDGSEAAGIPLILETSGIVLHNEHRCKLCNKLLAVDHLSLPALDIKCKRCGHLNHIFRDFERQVIITDKNGVILYVNKQVEKATGYSPEEVIGKTPAIWGSQMDKKFYKDLWKRIKVKKEAAIVSMVNKHKSGYLYSVMVRISPMLDVEGEVEFFIGIESITEESNPNLKD